MSDYTYGVSQGVLYPKFGPGVAWPGLMSVVERSEGGESQTFFYDGGRYSRKVSRESFNATVEAINYPFELDEARSSFGFSYREETGEDSYNINLIYNLLFVPSEIQYGSVNADGATSPFAWEAHSVPVDIPFAARGSHLKIDTSKATASVVTQLEDVLYGTAGSAPRLPTPEEIFSIFEASAVLVITDHGDGTWTATGPDEMITMLSPTSFVINSPTAIFVNEETYQITSF